MSGLQKLLTDFTVTVDQHGVFADVVNQEDLRVIVAKFVADQVDRAVEQRVNVVQSRRLAADARGDVHVAGVTSLLLVQFRLQRFDATGHALEGLHQLTDFVVISNHRLTDGTRDRRAYRLVTAVARPLAHQRIDVPNRAQRAPQNQADEQADQRADQQTADQRASAPADSGRLWSAPALSTSVTDQKPLLWSLKLTRPVEKMLLAADLRIDRCRIGWNRAVSFGYCAFRLGAWFERQRTHVIKLRVGGIVEDLSGSVGDDDAPPILTAWLRYSPPSARNRGSASPARQVWITPATFISKVLSGTTGADRRMNGTRRSRIGTWGFNW